MGRVAQAFSPGHVTVFFAPNTQAEDPAARGSTGAGFCVNRGVVSTVRVEPGRGAVRFPPGVEDESVATTRRAVQTLVAGTRFDALVEQTTDLPVGQGLGASAAGALSAGLAAAEALGLERSDAVAAAHCADVEEGTGLGDVVAAALGGFEVRSRPGLAPHGAIERILRSDEERRLSLALLAGPMSTSRVLADSATVDRIRRSGEAALTDFQAEPSLDAMCRVGRRFAADAGLVDKEGAAWLEQLGSVPAGPCLLGGSVFVFDDPARAVMKMDGGFALFPAAIDTQGARVLPVD